MGDSSISQTIFLNKTEYYTGLREMRFKTDLTLQPQYMAGNRIYIEVGIFGAPGAKVSYQRLFLDFMDTMEPVYYDNTNLIYVTVIPSSVFILAALISTATFFYFRKRKQQEEFLHGDVNKHKSE